MHTVSHILIHSSFCVQNFMLSAGVPNLIDVDGTTGWAGLV